MDRLELCKLAHEYFTMADSKQTAVGFSEWSAYPGEGLSIDQASFDSLIGCEGLTVDERDEVSYHVRKLGEQMVEERRQMAEETATLMGDNIVLI